MNQINRVMVNTYKDDPPNFGLKDRHREAIIATIAANDRVERAVLFGSRATGTYTPTSDVDIALFGACLTLADQAGLSGLSTRFRWRSRSTCCCTNVTQDRTIREHIRTHGIQWCTRANPDHRVPLVLSRGIDPSTG